MITHLFSAFTNQAGIYVNKKSHQRDLGERSRVSLNDSAKRDSISMHYPQGTAVISVTKDVSGPSIAEIGNAFREKRWGSFALLGTLASRPGCRSMKITYP